MKGTIDMAKKQKLRNVRASLGLTQKQLAEAAHVSEPAIIDIEKNRTTPRLITAYAIIDALNRELSTRNRDSLTINDLDWKVKEE